MPRGTNVSRLAMAYHFSCPLERADLAHAGYDNKRSVRLGLPFHEELEVRVWIDSVSIDREFWHFTSPITRQRASGRSTLNRTDRHWYRTNHGGAGNTGVTMAIAFPRVPRG